MSWNKFGPDDLSTPATVENVSGFNICNYWASFFIACLLHWRLAPYGGSFETSLEGSQKKSLSKPANFVRHLDTVPVISYVGKSTLVLFDVERHTGILVFLWWFNSTVQSICFAVSPLQFCRWECHTILHDVGPKTTWSASGEVHEGPRQFHSVQVEFSVTLPLVFQNHYPFKEPSLSWLRDCRSALLVIRDHCKMSQSGHSVCFSKFGHNAQLPTLFL